TTIYRWVQRYAPEMEKRLRWYWRNPSDLCPWHMDETYVKVNGRWAYLYRAVDSRVFRSTALLTGASRLSLTPAPSAFV
ncbi:DDE-type integrase/transposase/recombinase, partial [Escherichia coli]|nr:DDE-type integrase/transposase/recombinase [Escherichia coli]